MHTAPGHGHDDFVIGKKYGLEIYCPVDNAGRFASDVEHFAGLTVFEANPKIVDFMREQGVLLFSENYEHRYPHCWRCKNPVIFRATPQWFISMDEGGHSAKGEEIGRPNFSEGSSAQMKTHCARWLCAKLTSASDGFRRGAASACATCSKADPTGAFRGSVFGACRFPAFYCAKCEHVVADADVIRHVADIFEKETADAWYKREAAELLPEGFKCEKCGGDRVHERD